MCHHTQLYMHVLFCLSLWGALFLFFKQKKTTEIGFILRVLRMIRIYSRNCQTPKNSGWGASLKPDYISVCWKAGDPVLQEE